jgi:hypothetical protein
MSVAVHKPLSEKAIDDLIRRMESLRQLIEQRAEAGQHAWLDLPVEQQISARNLLHYLEH